MNAAGRLGSYGIGLVLVFSGAAAVAGAVVPETAVSAWTEHADAVHAQPDAAAADSEQAALAAPAGSVRGLSLETGGYQLSAITAPTRIRTPGDLSFRITGTGGQALTDYAMSHDKQLHLIVVRSDGSHYRHVHPVHRGGGEWTIPWAWEDAGSYRLFADFVPADTAQRPDVTLTRTVEVGGAYVPQPQTAPSTIATVDGFEVEVTGQLRATAQSELSVRITRAGRAVTALQPYLGAYGHLVALREGDLAYLHVHPEGSAPQAGERSGPTVSFLTQAPTAGRYLLFFDFQVDGKVRTATFAVDAAPPGKPAVSEPGTPTVAPHDSRDGH